MSTETKTIKLTLALAPRHIGNEQEAIKNKLKRMRLRSLPGHEGIMVESNNVQLLEQLGTILDEQPYVFWKVKFECVLFCPQIGNITKGVVQKILSGYFLAKVYESVTVTVSILDHLKDNDISKSLALGQEVYFRIKDAKEGTAITAEFDEECIDLVKNDLQNTSNYTDVYAPYSKDFQY